jgi:MFS family permease
MTFILAIVIFSICSVGSGLATGFALLLLARIVMGLAEGPVIPLAQLFVERESSPNRLGINVGILQAVGSALFGSILAPVILIQLAEDMDWRKAFYIASIPGLILASITFFYLKNSTAQSKNHVEEKGIRFKDLIKYHNIKWGIIVACCVMGWWFATLPFITKFFTDVQGMIAGEMQKTMGLLGVSMLFFSLFFPGISDKIGRKRTLLIAILIGMCFPFAVYYLNETMIHLPAMLLSYGMVGTIPLVVAVIPSEAVPNHLKGVAIGLVTAVGEVVGGVTVPAIAGALSDIIDESAFLWVSFAMAVLAFIFTLQLREQKKSSY